MEPCGRLLLSFPAYGMNVLPDGSVVVTGGGGRMKSGVPNHCEVHSFDENSCSFSQKDTVSLTDAPTAQATHGNTIITIVGTGCKVFLFENDKLTAESNFAHDITVSNTEEQSGIIFSADGTRLILASDQGPVRVLSFPDYDEIITEMRLHTDGVNDVDVSSDGKTVATTARDKCTFLWDATNGNVIQTLEPLFKRESRTTIRGVRFSPVESDLLFAVEANARQGGTTVSAWRRRPGDQKASWQSVATRHALSEAVCSLAISPDGRLLAVSSVEGHVALLSWSGRSLRPLWTTEQRTSWFQKAKPSHALPVTALRFSRSNNYLFTASADWTVAVWPAYRPWNVKGAFTFLRRLTWFLVLLLAYILGEHRLPPEVGQRRAELIPQLHPAISEFQETARPILAEKAEHARVLAERNVLPHLEPHIARFEREAMPVLRQQAANARAAKERFETETIPVLRKHAEDARLIIVPYIEQGLEKARSFSGKNAPSSPHELGKPSNFGKPDGDSEKGSSDMPRKTERGGVNVNVENAPVIDEENRKPKVPEIILPLPVEDTPGSVEGKPATETEGTKSEKTVDEAVPPPTGEDSIAPIEQEQAVETEDTKSAKPVLEAAAPPPVEDPIVPEAGKPVAETEDMKSAEPVSEAAAQPPVEEPIAPAKEKPVTKTEEKTSEEPAVEVAAPPPVEDPVAPAREKPTAKTEDQQSEEVVGEAAKPPPVEDPTAPVKRKPVTETDHATYEAPVDEAAVPASVEKPIAPAKGKRVTATEGVQPEKAGSEAAAAPPVEEAIAPAKGKAVRETEGEQFEKAGSDAGVAPPVEEAIAPAKEKPVLETEDKKSAGPVGEVGSPGVAGVAPPQPEAGSKNDLAGRDNLNDVAAPATENVDDDEFMESGEDSDEVALPAQEKYEPLTDADSDEAPEDAETILSAAQLGDLIDTGDETVPKTDGVKSESAGGVPEVGEGDRRRKGEGRNVNDVLPPSVEKK